MQDKSNGELVDYFNCISVKPYDPLLGCYDPALGSLPEIPGIVEMNRDVESFVIQSTACVTPLLHRGQYEPLTFVHFSDIHAVTELWNRTVDYINHYREYIAFGLHTGDYCCDNQDQWRDLYSEGACCQRPIFNCVGNHDTFAGSQRQIMPKEEAWKRLFLHTQDWNVSFLDCPYSMAYSRDFPESNIRLIVLDQYFDVEAQRAWLKNLLEDAGEKGLWVITAMHEPSAEVTQPVGVTFHTLTEFDHLPEGPFEAVLSDYVKKGGRFLCNFCGHEHHDLFGYTAGGVLNVAVECACDWAGWCDGRRVRGSKTYDCFNVVTVDADQSLLKLVRVGNNTDYFLRKKQVLCFDYQKHSVIFNG